MTVAPLPVEDSPLAPLSGAIPRRGSWLTRAIGRLVLRLMGWRFTGAFPNEPKMVMIGAPHTSNWDFPVALGAAFAVSLGFTFVGKHVLFRRPFGWFFRLMGGIPVDRTRSQAFVQQMVDEFSARDRFLLAIAPEGTRKQVDRWRTGFYHIAVGARVPILLVTFDNARRNLHVGPAITPTGDLDADLERILQMYAERLGRPVLP